jgi:DNA polymerase-1
MSKTFILIDGHAVIYRAYHAFKELSTPEGVLVNAVYGFSRALLTVIREFSPEYIAVTFDHAKPTFRHADYLGYKLTREAMPDDLRPQVDLIKEVVTSFNIPQFELAGYEADDLIGTLARQIKEDKEMKVIIVTGDRDSFQLVDDQVHVWMQGRPPFSKFLVSKELAKKPQPSSSRNLVRWQLSMKPFKKRTYQLNIQRILY